MKPMPRHRTRAAALIAFGISACRTATAIASGGGGGGKTSNLRFGFTSTTLTVGEKEGGSACFRGWNPTCQDDPNYVSRFGLTCEGHGFFQCELFLDLGFSPQEVSNLITSCPCSCSINCSDDSWKAAIGLDRIDQPTETTTDALLEESSASPTAHPTQYETGSPTTAPTTASPTDLPTTLIPSSTPTNKPSLHPTTIAPTIPPSSMPTQYDNTITSVPTPTPTDTNKLSPRPSTSAETTGFPTTSPDSKAPTISPSWQPVESESDKPEALDQTFDVPNGEARGKIPNVGLDGESDALQATQDERPGSNSGSGMTLSLMELILICVGMVAITMTLLVAHGVYRRSKALKDEENGDLGRDDKIRAATHKSAACATKKKSKKSQRNKNADKRTIKRIVRGLGGGKDEPSSSSPVIKEGAAVVIASSTRSRCNHEALLVESFSSVSDSQASTLHRKRGPHKSNNRVQISRDVCELPSNLVLEAV